MLSCSTKWNEANEIFAEHPLWRQAEPLDRLVAFDLFIKAEDRKEQSEKKKQRLRQERKRREAFTDFVKDLLSQRKITNQTQWYQFVQEFKNEERYRDLVG